jgi:hypothetical protein
LQRSAAVCNNLVAGQGRLQPISSKENQPDDASPDAQPSQGQQHTAAKLDELAEGVHGAGPFAAHGLGGGTRQLLAIVREQVHHFHADRRRKLPQHETPESLQRAATAA